jgi:hypothetical protein
LLLGLVALMLVLVLLLISLLQRSAGLGSSLFGLREGMIPKKLLVAPVQ